MKICVVNPNFYRSSGVTTAIKRIHEGAAQFGLDQFFVTCGYGQDQDDDPWIPADRYAQFDLMTAKPTRLFAQLRRFSKWLADNGIEIVHVHHRRLAALLSLNAIAARYKVVYTGQLTYPWNPLWRLIPIETSVAISQSVARNMQKTMWLHKLATIGNPARFPASCPVMTNPPNRAVCIGRLEPVKGHEFLIRAWSSLAAKGHSYVLSIVGEGSLRSKLESLVRQLGINQLVEFRGFQSNVDSEIERASFSVLASKTEGHPLAVLECAARGRASLLTDVDGSRDCLPPHRTLPNGIPFGDVAALAAALETWISSPPAKIVSEGQAFYSFLKSEASVESVAAKYAAVYSEVQLAR